MCWPPRAEQIQTYILSFTEAIAVKLLSRDKTAELPKWSFFFCLTFGPIEVKWIDLSFALVLAVCIIIILLTLTYSLKVISNGPLPSAESMCAVLDWSIGERNLWSCGPGLDVVGCQLKDILSDPNNRWNCCICLLSWVNTRKVFSSSYKNCLNQVDGSQLHCVWNTLPGL